MMSLKEFKDKADKVFKKIKESIVLFFSDRENVKAVLFTLLYAAVTFVLLSRHEIWADEAHVWMQIKYKTLADLFRYSMGEGHPFLFYALMFPFVKAGFSMEFLRVFCWLSVSAGIFFFLRYAPFCGILKTAVLLSAPFIYFFPVHARNYSLIPLFMFSAGALYGSRHKYPLFYLLLILCLASSHFLATVPALYLAGCFFYEMHGSVPVKFFKRLFLPALAVFLFLYIQADSAFGGNTFYKIGLKGNFEIVVIFLQSFFSCFTEYFVSEPYLIPESFSVYAACVFTSLLIAALFFSLFYRSVRYFAGAAAALCSQFIIYFFIYPLVYPPRVYCFSVFLLFFFWLAFADEKNAAVNCSGNYKNIPAQYGSFPAGNGLQSLRNMLCGKGRKISEMLLFVLFAMAVPTGVHMAAKDFNGPFSSAPEMAAFIRSHISPNDIVLSSTDFIEGLLYHIQDRNIGYKSIKSLHFAINSGDHDYEEADIMPYVKAGHRVYLVFNWNADFDEKLYPVFHTHEAIKNRESFTLVQLLSDMDFAGPLPAAVMQGKDRKKDSDDTETGRYDGFSDGLERAYSMGKTVAGKEPFFHHPPYFYPEFYQ